MTTNNRPKHSTEMPTDVLFISRGRGRGHAVPDMAIGRELTTLAPGTRINFVSYATGAETYRACGCPVTDVQASENPPFWEMVIVLEKLGRRWNPKPRLIVSHEELPAVIVSEMLEIPCLFITDFFMDPSGTPMQTLTYAREVIFLGEPGVFTEPPLLRDKVRYVGRAVRPLEYGVSDRGRARAELGIPLDAVVVLFQPGMWPESQVPVTSLLLSAWKLLPYPSKRLIWIAARDYDGVRARVTGEPDIVLLTEDWKLDRLMAASNVVVTKATRTTTYEAAAIGVPSVSISNLANWPDDVAVAQVPSNIPIIAESATPERLRDAIVVSIDSHPAPATAVSRGVQGAAERIASYLDSLDAA